MGSQLKFVFIRPLCGALMITGLAAAAPLPARAEGPDSSPQDLADGPLPANVLCWPANAHDAALGEHERDGRCNPKSANNLRPIDLKAPFRQFNAEGPNQLSLMAGAHANAPEDDLFDLSALVGALDSLSKSDLLLLGATARGDRPAIVSQTMIVEGRRVAGIRDFGAGEGSAWVLRPEVPAYLANEAAGLRIASQSVRELHDASGADTGDEDAPVFSFWTRAVGRDNELSGVSGTAFSSQTAMALMNAGVDFQRGALFADSDRLHLGLMATYGNAVSDASAAENSASATGKVAAARIGGYATWYRNEADHGGAFVDSWFAVTLLDNTVIGEDLATESYRSTAWAGSMEAGYAWLPFDSALRIEPRLQVSYAQYNQSTHQEFNGTEVAGVAGGLSVRLGARVEREWRFDDGMVLKPYAELNWRHDFTSSDVSFDGVRVSAAAPDDRMEFAVGFDANLGAKWALGLVLQTQQAITDDRGVEALVSIKCDW